MAVTYMRAKPPHERPYMCGDCKFFERMDGKNYHKGNCKFKQYNSRGRYETWLTCPMFEAEDES